MNVKIRNKFIVISSQEIPILLLKEKDAQEVYKKLGRILRKYQEDNPPALTELNLICDYENWNKIN